MPRLAAALAREFWNVDNFFPVLGNLVYIYIYLF